MKQKSDFDQFFTLSLAERFDPTFLSIFSVVSFVFLIAIIIVANLNYERLQEDAEKIIRSRYKTFISQLIIEEDKKSSEIESTLETGLAETAAESPLPVMSAAERRKNERESLTEDITKNNPIFNSEGSGNDAYAHLPDVDDFETDEFGGDGALIELSRPAGSSKIMNHPRGVFTHYEAGSIDDLLRKPFNYNLSRQGEVYINLTDELSDEPEEKKGYRDPDEVERVVYQYQPMIQYCFQKEARFHSGLKGYIKVEFSISPAGFVLPESIRIISSTLQSRRVEQCIKNYIRRWRGFAKLDESMGIARVTQKFVFN